MARSALAIFLFSAVALTSPAHGALAKVTPVQKVLQMLNDMLLKGKAAKNAETVTYEGQTETFCLTEIKRLDGSIKEATQTIEMLTSGIMKATSTAERLDREIAVKQSDMDTVEKEREEARAERAKEKEHYNIARTDVLNSISAVVRAIATLKAEAEDKTQVSGTGLVQLKNHLSGSQYTRLDSSSQNLLDSYITLQGGDANGEPGTPEAYGYEFQSGGVVDMLSKLKLKFENQRDNEEKEEMKKQNDHDLLAQGMTDRINQLKAIITKKSEYKDSEESDAATKKEAKTVALDGKENDATTLEDTKQDCLAKSREYTKNQQTRAEEISAIERAIEYISSEQVSGTATRHLPGTPAMVQEVSTSMAQLRSTLKRDASIVRAKIRGLLEQSAKKMNSRYLELVALRVQEDPLMKVKTMIKGLIAKLMEEANAEMDHHAYCQGELAENTATRNVKTADIERMTAKLDERTAQNQQMTSQIAALSEAMVAIREARKEAVDMRTEAKETNTNTIRESKEAQSSVSKAIVALQNFYTPGESASLLQDAGQDQEGAMADNFLQVGGSKPYEGMGGAGSGVLGLLEVIMSDFARLQAETEEAEDTESDNHEKYMTDSAQDLAIKETEQDHIKSKNEEAEADINYMTKQIENTQKELDASNDYYNKLKTDCIDTGLSYEERKEKREQEIQSLKEALEMLTNEELVPGSSQ